MTNSNDEKHAKKMLILMGILGGILGGVGFWYWYGPYQDSQIEAGRLLDPAVVMQRCIAEWKAMQAAKEMPGFGVLGTRAAERDCAEMHSLYLRDGKWQRKQDH